MKKTVKYVSVLGVMLLLSGCIVHDGHRGNGYHGGGHHSGHHHGAGWHHGHR
uniref:hypothetical protein n=1 Tax=Pantoea sp. IMH TaxID=1267600 RepID=UPI0004B7F2F6|nr:hypothetical protein [Pantoea sp. IMH]